MWRYCRRSGDALQISYKYKGDSERLFFVGLSRSYHRIFMGKAEVKGLRWGYTTGSCAAAAAKGATCMLDRGEILTQVTINTPSGKTLTLPLIDQVISKKKARCAVVKDAGDDPDVTHGIKIFAEVELSKGKEIEIFGGEGVGVVTKPGLQVPVGYPAINPVPRKMIEQSVREVTHKGVKVIISVPGGEEIAKKTFNPKLGILGGISIIGTTGLVEPKSLDAYKTSLLCSLDVAKAQGFSHIILVPGNIGARAVKKLLSPQEDQLIQMGDFVGFMLKKVALRDFKKVILAGHPGKLAKLIAGDFDTHSKRSKSALSIVSQMAKKLYNSFQIPEEISSVEGIIQIFPQDYKEAFFSSLAKEIKKSALQYVEGKLEIEVILFSMDGSPIGFSTPFSSI